MMEVNLKERMLFTATAVIAICLCLSSGVFAEEDGFELSELEETVLSEGRRSGFKVSSVPLTQISPAFKTVTYALALDYIDTTVTPEESDFVNSNFSQTRKFEIDGYTVAPYLALSLRNIGVGISGEIGQRKVSYLDASTVTGIIGTDNNGNQTTNNSYSNYRQEESQLNYTGLGVYLYLNLTPKWKKFVLNATLGTKTLTGKHEAKSLELASNSAGYSGDYSQGGDTGEWETIKYTVTRTEIGFNARWWLGKRFSLIPWAHYMIVNTDQIDDLLDRCSDRLNTSDCSVTHANRYYSDVQLFWHARNPLYTGLDLTAKYGRFEIHLGGAVGGLVNLASARLWPKEETGPVMEDTYTISVSASYESKTR